MPHRERNPEQKQKQGKGRSRVASFLFIVLLNVLLGLTIAAQVPAPANNGERISVNLKDAPLSDFFRTVSGASKLNVVMAPNVVGTVTLSVVDMPWEEALDRVLQNNRLGTIREGNVLQIMTEDAARREISRGTPRRYNGERMSFNFLDMDLKDFFVHMHDRTGLDIVVGSNVNGKLTLALQDVPWDQALGIVFRTFRLAGKRENNLLWVMTEEGASKEGASTSEAISFKLTRTDVRDFFRVIGDISRLQLRLDPDVFGELTTVLEHVPWDRALEIVLANNHLVSKRENNTLRIMTQETAERERAGGIKAERWALIVGVSKYAREGIGDLQYARRDAEALYAFLRSPQGGAFAEDHIKLLVDERATANNVRGGLRDFLGRAAENDLVMIFFAGHGTPDPARPNVLYFVAHDSDPQQLGATALDMEEIKLALTKTISARRVLVMADTCHSAGVSTIPGARLVANPLEMVNRYLTELAQSRPGVVMFTASQSNEPSYESANLGGGHGIFTHFLLQGLQGEADRDMNEIVTLQELVDFVSDRVKKQTDYKQHPTYSSTPTWDPNLPLAVLKRP